MIRDRRGTTGSARAGLALRAASGLLLAALAAAPAALAAGAPATPIVSGLLWRSGSTTFASSGDGDGCLAALRGRPLDANIVYLRHRTFADTVDQSAAYPRDEAKLAPLLAVTVPLLTNDTAGQFAQCAAGAFDASFRQIGANLQNAGAQGVVVRLGPEANVGAGSHPWGLDSLAQVPAYKACWRRAASQLRSAGPSLRLEWANAKKGKLTFNVLQTYPGDDVVDLWGVHYYDSGPQMSTQAAWDSAYWRTNYGGPWGLGVWLAAAQAHGKKLAVSEWGVWQQDGQAAAAADDPVYVDNMYRFFRSKGPYVAYETYFNSLGVHQLCPGTLFPNAAAKYQADWSSGK